jgi:predicted DCC family thiol-disulfide oxidoreductase YuxK
LSLASHRSFSIEGTGFGAHASQLQRRDVFRVFPCIFRLTANIRLNVNEFADLDHRLLVIFDGNCGFCNASVRWFLRRDRCDRLRFAPSEAPRVAALLERHGFSVRDFPWGPSTIVVVRNPGDPAEQIYLRSDAAAALLAELPRPWSTAGKAFQGIPRPLRDLGYRIVASLRYRFWGRTKTCPLPTLQERAHFL